MTVFINFKNDTVLDTFRRYVLSLLNAVISYANIFYFSVNLIFSNIVFCKFISMPISAVFDKMNIKELGDIYENWDYRWWFDWTIVFMLLK